MRKLGRTSSDALELLLDTVCSMFGAILLIAILVALMAQTARVDSSGEQASAEMLQRKIATAEADLAETQRLTAALTAPTENPSIALATEKQKIGQALATARAQRARTAMQLRDQVERQTADFSAEWKKLGSDSRALERRLAELDNAIKAQDQNSARMSGRMAELSTLIHQEKESRVVTLRFPKERARTKRALPVICKFGKVYPLMDADRKQNNDTIAWTSKGSDADLSRPIAERGWTPEGNKAAIEDLLRKIPSGETYLAFYVYPDSFDAFHAVREQAIAMQLDFGVDLQRAGNDLVWGAEGTSPPPL